MQDNLVYTASSVYTGPANVSNPQPPEDAKFRAYTRLRGAETHREAQLRGLQSLMSTRPGVDRLDN